VSAAPRAAWGESPLAQARLEALATPLAVTGRCSRASTLTVVGGGVGMLALCAANGSLLATGSAILTWARRIARAVAWAVADAVTQTRAGPGPSIVGSAAREPP
jgi:hypothetical protein